MQINTKKKLTISFNKQMVSSKALNFSLSIFFCFFLNVTLEKIRTLVEEENIYAKIGKPITINCLFKDFKIDSLTEKNHKFSWFWKKEVC